MSILRKYHVAMSNLGVKSHNIGPLFDPFVGAWIITGGTGTGVMQFVGEAVRDHQLTAGGVTGQPVVALGIATWGIVDNKQALISDGVRDRSLITGRGGGGVQDGKIAGS